MNITSKTKASDKRGSPRYPQQDRQYVILSQNGGGTHSRELTSLAKEIWDFLLSKQITITAECLPGILNVQADRASRHFQDSIALLPIIPENLPEIWSPGHGFVCLQTVSPNPSVHDVGRVVAKVRVEEVSMILITPAWQTPAIESLDHGIETATQDKGDSLDSEEKDTQDSVQSSSSSPSHHQDQDSENKEENEQSTGSRAVIKNMGKARRELLKNIKEKKDSKLTKQHSVDVQLLDAAKEEIALKKRALEMMENADKRHEETMQGFLQSMNLMAASIGNGFNMLQGLLQQPSCHFNQQPTFSGTPQHINPGFQQPFPRRNMTEERNQGSYMSYLEEEPH